MGLLKSIYRFFNKPQKYIITIYAPLTGEVHDLTTVSDIVFSDLILGDGIAIAPTLEQNELLSPTEGIIKRLYQTQHAVIIENPFGADIFVHVGFNTLNLRGRYFSSLVSVNEEVELTTPLLNIDFKSIIHTGIEIMTPVVVTNLGSEVQIINKAPVGSTVIAGESPIFEVVIEK